MCTIARFEVMDFLRRQRDFRVTFDQSLIDRIADMQVTNPITLKRVTKARGVLRAFGPGATRSLESAIRPQLVG